MVDKSKLRLFYKASLELLESQSLRQNYEVIVKWAIKLVDGKYGSIFVIKDHTPIRVYTSDSRLYSIIPRKNGNTYNAFKTRKPYLKSTKEFAPFHPIIKKMGVASGISVPLNSGKERIGVLSVLSHKNKPFKTQDLEIMKLFAPLASYSIRQQKLQEDLKNILRERDLFISMAAHEIRTPLTSIYIYTQLMAQDLDDKGSQEDKYLNKIKYGVGRLNSLVNDFLSVQQINTKSINYQFHKISIFTLLNEAIGYFYFHYPKHKVELFKKSNEKYFVYADAGKLHQAIVNILRNAGKYSSTRQPILISLTKEGRIISIVITDHGEGIAKHDMNHIFEKFYRNKNTKSEGMGLGLFLTKSIIEAHDGKISISSQKGKGTTVILTLPVYKNDSGKSQSKTSGPSINRY